MVPRTLSVLLVAVLATAPFASAEPPSPPSAPVEAELGVEAQAIVDAAQALTVGLNASSPRADVGAAHDALLALMASVDAKVKVGDPTFEAPTVKTLVQEEIDKTFWLLVLLDARADPLAAYDTAVAKVESAEDKLDVDVTARGARHARHQLQHALAIVTALDIVGGVDAELVADLTARIQIDLDRCRGAIASAEACGCPITLEVQTAVNVVVAATVDVADHVTASVNAAASAVVGFVKG